MKIGYPCINRSVDCRGNRTFRLKSYSQQRLIQTVQENLSCLDTMLRYNTEHNLLFFRITSDLVPFASHPVCDVDWQNIFKDGLEKIGRYIKKQNIRISMHPDQFTLINSLREDVFERSCRELEYHCQVLDVMKLDLDAKIQIHVGGVYGDKPASIKRFTDRYHQLDPSVRRRLVIENDDRQYSLQDCLIINRKCSVPVLFDFFHHRLLNQGEPVEKAITAAAATWKKKDGILMVDYSSQQPGKRPGSHTESIDTDDFAMFLQKTKGMDFDIMLEIKDKEKSGLKAVQMVSSLQ